MLRLQTPLPERYTAASADDLADRIASAKAALGDRLFILGHHYQRDDVIRWADAEGRITVGVEPDGAGRFYAVRGIDDPLRVPGIDSTRSEVLRPPVEVRNGPRALPIRTHQRHDVSEGPGKP